MVSGNFGADRLLTHHVYVYKLAVRLDLVEIRPNMMFDVGYTPDYSVVDTSVHNIMK